MPAVTHSQQYPIPVRSRNNPRKNNEDSGGSSGGSFDWSMPIPSPPTRSTFQTT
ncbi:hypothetical protein HK102_009844, partial [Quaeritorhiza haematococci]